MKKYARLLLVLPLIISQSAFSQTEDSLKKISHFNGNISITNNGISLIPTFSLNKPAGAVILSVGRNKFSFDPEIWFSLGGKPWSFLFWFRYQAIKTNKFSLRVGAHPALNFITENISINGEDQEQVIARRYVAAEIVPDYFLNKNISIGVYYLHGRGFDKGGIRYSHFLTFNSNFSNIRVSRQFYFTFIPQVFYLKMERNDGLFATATVGLNKKNFPLSVSAIFNKQIREGIPGAKDFVWNASLIYAFSKNYVRHQ